MKGKEDHKLNANLGYKIHNKFLLKTKRNKKKNTEKISSVLEDSKLVNGSVGKGASGIHTDRILYNK